MNPILLNIILLIISITICQLWYFSMIRKKYGLLPSISHSAKYLQKDGKQVYFYIFILIGVVFPLSYMSGTFYKEPSIAPYFTSISGGLLGIIGIFTGYNPDIKSKKWQNGLHVFFTQVSIIGFTTGVILMHWQYSIVIGIIAIPSFILWIKKIPDHTRLIEQLLIYGFWFCLTIDKIIIPCG